MPRLPRFRSQAALPASTGQPTIDVSGAGAPMAAVQRAALGLSGAIADTTGAVLYASARAERERQKVEDAKRKQRADTDTAAILADTEEAIGLLESDLKATVTDPDQYLQAHTEGLQRIAAHARQRVRFPETGQALATRLPGITGRAVVAGRQRSDALFLNSETAKMEHTLDQIMRLGSETPLHDDVEFLRHLTDGVDAIIAAKPMLGSDKALARGRKFRDDMVYDRALTHKNADPAGFLRDVTGDREIYRQMDPTARERLAEQARTDMERIARDTLTRQDKYEKDLAKQADDERASVYADMQQRAFNQQLPLQEIENRRALRTIDATQYEHLRKIILEPAPDRPSERGLYDTIALDVHSTRPRTSEREIDDMHELHRKTGGERGINLKDALALKDRVRTQKNALREQGESDVMRRHQQAEQLLNVGLTTRSPFEAIDPKSQKAKTLALQELTNRSSAFGGKEDPLAVAREMLPRFQGYLGEQTKIELQDIRKTLRFANPNELEAAFKAGRVPKAEYDFQRKRFLELERASRDAIQIEERQTGPGKAGGSKDQFGR